MIVFDIETAPMTREEIIAAMPVFDQSEVKLGNRTNPVSIMEYMERQEEEYYARLVDRAALDARTSRVLCIGSMEDGKEPEILSGEERTVIEGWWAQLIDLKDADEWVGFNILSFDLPFLVRRSWLLDISVPNHIWEWDHRRFHHQVFIDLMQVWNCGRREDSISLAAMAKFLGVGEKTGSGADFAELWKSDRVAAEQYVKNDLALTWACAQKML